MRLPSAVLLTAALVLSIGFSRTTITAADGTLSGVVTDETGKPVRAALVKATAGPNAVSRFTDDNGRYEITGLKLVEHQVQASAPGYAIQTLRRAASDTGAMNFSLKPRFDITRLSTSELLSALPQNRETRFIQASCSGCHTLLPIQQKRGLESSEWQDILKRMGQTTGLGFGGSPARMAYVGEMLEKYFGPDGEAERIDPKAVKYVPVAPEVLNATYYEFRTPTYAKLIHSIAADAEGNGWFTEYDWQSNKMAVLNFEKGEIKEFPIATKNSAPHTPILGPEGNVWTPLADGNKLLLLEPKTGQMTEYEIPWQEWGMKPGDPARLHTPAVAKDGTVWLSSTLTRYLYSFEPKTKKWDRFPVADPVGGDETQGALSSVPGETRGAGLGASYHVELDSQGYVWYTQLSQGTVVRFDPKTKENKVYKAPGVVSSRGLAVDAQDNIWYSNWDGHTIVKLDRKTETFRHFQPPTPFASAYGMVFDKQGNLWYADYMGNNITMFDPRTEKFIEYPMPTGNSMPRFISVDNQGRVWFTEWWHSKVGVLVPNGTAAPAQRAAR